MDSDKMSRKEVCEFAKSVALQFGYYFPHKDVLMLSTGGLSVLEEAFDILHWDNPHPVPECECEFDGCHEFASCGIPTEDGYKRVCSNHFNVINTQHKGNTMKK